MVVVEDVGEAGRLGRRALLVVSLHGGRSGENRQVEVKGKIEVRWWEERLQGRVGKAVELVHRSQDVLRVMREEGVLCGATGRKHGAGSGTTGESSQLETRLDETRRDEMLCESSGRARPGEGSRQSRGPGKGRERRAW